MTIRTLRKGVVLQCNCNRPNCGLLSNPPEPDEIDAKEGNLWIPAGYTNFIELSEFLAFTKSAESIYKTRLVAAKEYVSYMVGGK